MGTSRAAATAVAIVGVVSVADAAHAQSAAPASAPEASTAPVVIDFEDVNDLDAVQGSTLGERYRQPYGVRFGLGAKAIVCQSSNPDDAAARGFLCPYPRAASGRQAGYFDLSADELEIGFDRPPTTVSFAINPTGGALGQSYEIIITAFDASDALIGRNVSSAVWGEDAFTWPTRASFSGGGRPIARLLVATSRGRFLFDDLRLDFEPPGSEVYADLAAAAAAPALRNPAPVSTAEAERGLEIYPAAPRVRTEIDWAAAVAARAAQRAAGIADVRPEDSAGLNAALLPVLAPFTADGGAIDVASIGDTYAASYAVDGRDYVSSGARVLVEMPGGSGAAGPNLEFADLEYGMSASFALYGAAYQVMRLCTEAEMRAGAGCYDEAAMRAALRSLNILIGASGEARP